MSVTAPSRVDNTTPVLAHLVDAASKGFTGAIEVSTNDSAGRDLQVVIWLEDGGIYAVHANGWNPPALEYVRHRTGVDFSDRDESPFKAAYETLRDGVPMMSADDLDVPRRDSPAPHSVASSCGPPSREGLYVRYGRYRIDPRTRVDLSRPAPVTRA